MEQDILIKVEKDKWPVVIDSLKNDFPRSIMFSNVIKNFIEWDKKGITVDFNVYAPEGDPECGTYFLIFRSGIMFALHVYTLEKSCDKLKECLRTTKVINWAEGPFFYSVNSAFWPHILDVMKELNNEAEFTLESETQWISKEDALKFDTTCPSDVRISKLDTTNVEMIDDLWPHKYPGSAEYIAETIDANGGLGIYTKDNELIGWVIKNHLLGVGILHTLENHTRKGYGQLLVKSMTKSLIEEGINVHAAFLKKNKKSQQLFAKLNFKRADDIFYYKVKGSE